MVVVTTSQYSKGLFCTWAATRPEMWAMSILFGTSASSSLPRTRRNSHEVRAVEVGNLAKTGVVKVPGVGGGTADEDPGLEEESVLLERIVVDQAGGGVDLVGEGLEVDGGGGDLALGSVGTVGTASSSLARAVGW